MKYIIGAAVVIGTLFYFDVIVMDHAKSVNDYVADLRVCLQDK